MSVAAPMMTRPLEVTTPGDQVVDDDGQPVTDERGRPMHAEPTSIVVLGHLELTPAGEVTVGQQTAPAVGWAGLPADTTVKATSTVRTLDTDQTFDVAGEPDPKWDPWEQRTDWVKVVLALHTAS